MFRGTTIICARRPGEVALAGDGQVSLGDTVLKHSGNKTRRLYSDKVIAGFAGSTADAFTLFEKFDAKLEEFSGNLPRAAVSLARDWRSDRYLRRLEDGIAAIGSGGNYATAAGRALLRDTELDAKSIAEKAINIAAEICIYTNDQITIEALP